MLNKHLHIICLDIPYPVDYGGVFDLFYKLVALKKEGVNIILHCFYKERRQAKILENYCTEIYYYKRSTNWLKHLSPLPYIVSSRQNNELISKLKKDNYPILMEGIHCTYPALITTIEKRRFFVRLHNTEFIYYGNLASNAVSPFKKLFYKTEAGKLKQYEQKLIKKVQQYFAVSKSDELFYRKAFNATNINFLSLFMPEWAVKNNIGTSDYCLYNGNLSVEENERAAVNLIQVFKTLPYKLIIAGKSPSNKLKHVVKVSPRATLVENPSEEKMHQLITNAQVNILFSYNSTGIKLKLLNTLFNGRHCITNNAGVEGSGLTELCHVLKDETNLQNILPTLMKQEITQEELQKRKVVLHGLFNNEQNAKILIDTIWGNT